MPDKSSNNSSESGDRSTDSGGEPDIEIGPVRDADTGDIVDADPTDSESGASGTSEAAALGAALREGEISADKAEKLFEEGGKGLTPQERQNIKTEIGQEQVEQRLRESGDLPERGEGTPTAFVTGGPGTGQPQRQVGAGDSRVEAAVEAAADEQNFDAFQGTTINRFEETLGTDQGAERPEDEIVTAEGPTGVRPRKTSPDAGAAASRGTREKRRNVQPVEDPTLAEQSILTGVNVMQTGQELSEDVQSLIKESGVDLPEESISPVFGVAESTGEIAEDFGLDIGEDVDEEIESFQRETIGGTATLGTQLGGLAVATPGALARATREDTPSIQEGVAEGVQLTGQEVAEDPAEFLASEAGEEVGEAAVGTLLLGPAGVALGATPTPEITPTVEAKAATTERFVRGDLGTQVEAENVVTQPIPEDGQATADFFRRETEQLEEGGRAQQAVRIDTEEETVTVGQRKETPVSRRQFLREELEAGSQRVDQFLSGNAIGTGPGAFLPAEATPETSPELDTEVDIDQPLFEESTTEQDLLVERISRPSSVRPRSIENLQETQGQSFDQELFEPEQKQEPPEEITEVTRQETTPEQRQEPTITPLLNQRTDFSTETLLSTSPESTIETERKLESEKPRAEDDENGESILDLTFENTDQEIDTTVAAELLGIEDQGKSKNPTNPLSLRLGF